MKFVINQDWHDLLSDQWNQDYFKELTRFVSDQYNSHTCYPDRQDIFKAFNSTAVSDVKVVVIGQDPYHGVGQADGLCFSVPAGIPHPPSLKNIFKELHDDLHIDIPESGHLGRWASQGVLLLNTVLTVNAHQPGSHAGMGWEQFTDTVINRLSHSLSDVIFVLWGGFAHKKEKLISTNRHHILKSGHPSPLSANRGYWFGNKHFSRVNDILQQLNKEPIKW